MIHDPASPDFVKLPRQQQAVILSSLGWDIPSLMDEFGVSRQSIRRWIDAEYKARRDALHAVYRKSEKGKAANNAAARRRNAAKTKEQRRYWADPEYRERHLAYTRERRKALRQQRETAHAL